MNMIDCLTSAKLEVDKALLLLDLLVQEYPPEDLDPQGWNYKQVTVFIDYVQGSVYEINKSLVQAIKPGQTHEKKH